MTLADANDSARAAILQALIDPERPTVWLMPLEDVQQEGPIATLLQFDEDLDQQPVAELVPFDDPTPTLAEFDDTEGMVEATLIPFDEGTDDVQATLFPLDTVLGCESVPAGEVTAMLLPLDDSIDASTVSLLAVSSDINANRARLAPLGVAAKSLDLTLTPLGFLHAAFAGWASYGRALSSSLVTLDQAALRAQGAIADLAVQSSVVRFTLAGLSSPTITRPGMLKTLRSTLPGQLTEWRRRATAVSTAMQTLTRMRNATATTWLEF